MVKQWVTLTTPAPSTFEIDFSPSDDNKDEAAGAVDDF